ncbi:MAG: V-type ATPase subunit [Candidatus Peregrinibacteria bacterium]|nr:V-type ATPase subunit [Candidatus Peregrinibacteria bacterium]MCB9808090.1 V-type ATPase subunit [Candidatus Peribacteria bacterium]
MPVFSSMVGQHFAYASGRSGVLQNMLLSSSDRDRLLGAKDLREAEAILTELKLTNPIDQGLKKSAEILSAIEEWVRKEVEHMTPASKLPTFAILWMEYDIPLIAYLLKKHVGLTSAVSTVPNDAMASCKAGEIESFLAERKNEGLPSHLINFLQTALQWENPTPQYVDAQVSQYITSRQLMLARASGSKLIVRYVRNKIDIVNIRTALRLVEEKESSSDHLIMGGGIDPKKLTGNLESILHAINASSLPYELAERIRKASNDTNALELALSDVLAKDIADMWNIPLSIEPVFAFAALAQSQLKLLRTLLIGKRAAMSPQEIKHVLPPFISASHYLS